MEEVTAGVYLVSISQSRDSAVYGGGHAKTVFLQAAISAAAHQTCEMFMNAQFRFCRDERSELQACCNWPQSTPQIRARGQNKFLRKLRAKIQFLRLLFSSLRNISPYNPHTILKNARRGRLKNIFIFIYRSSK